MSETQQDQKNIQPATDADLMRTNAMQAKHIEALNEQLKLAVDALAKVNDEKSARDEAERQSLINHLIIDSGNKLTVDSFKDMTTKEIKAMRIMADSLGSSQEKMIASVAAMRADQLKPKLQGIDYWDGTQWRMK
jgi:uncharacterized coiled-coil protein SlyX